MEPFVMHWGHVERFGQPEESIEEHVFESMDRLLERVDELTEEIDPDSIVYSIVIGGQDGANCFVTNQPWMVGLYLFNMQHALCVADVLNKSMGAEIFVMEWPTFEEGYKYSHELTEAWQTCYND